MRVRKSLFKTRRPFPLKNSSNLSPACSIKLGLTPNIRRQRHFFLFSILRALSLRKMSVSVAIKATAWEGKWQVSWCQLCLFSILVYEESDRNKAWVNKVRLGQRQSGICRSRSHSLTPLGRFTTGLRINSNLSKMFHLQELSPV